MSTHDQHPQEPADEIAALRQRIAMLESQLRTRRRSETILKAMLDQLPVVVYIVDEKGIFTFSDGSALQSLGLQPGAVVGLSVFEVYKDFPPILEAIKRTMAGETFTYFAKVGAIQFNNWATPLYNEQNELEGILGVSFDITEQGRAEEERSKLQEQIIQTQEAMLNELSTPLIPLADNVVAMPLIGSIDSRRAQQLVDTLLEGVSALQARMTILDITGVPVVDTQVANALIRAAQAVRLLGAKVILTGIRPEVAQTLVGLGVDMTDIITRGTLQSGIAYALNNVGTRRQGQ
jgi:rsbT co-antagonist protein RsbR